MKPMVENKDKSKFAGANAEFRTVEPGPGAHKLGFVHYWDFPDLEPHHAHWRGPSWFGIKGDGTIEAGAAYLANMRRNDGPLDNGQLMNFGIYWQMFNAEGQRIWYSGVFLVWDLGYKKVAENVARQWPGGQVYQELVNQSTSCSIERVITTHMSPRAPTIPVVDIPWNP